MYRSIPKILIKFLEREEGVRFTPYQDSKGVWTVGVGHTGVDVQPGTRLSQDQVDTLLMRDLGVAQRRLTIVLSQAAIDALNDYQYSALLSFVFNVGALTSWSIWPPIEEKHYDEVPGHLAQFVKAGGEVVQGLVNRRNAEIALWNGSDPLCVSFPIST